MTDQELKDEIVIMTLAVGTNYTEIQLRSVLDAKTSGELQLIYDRAKKSHDTKFPSVEQAMDNTGS